MPEVIFPIFQRFDHTGIPVKRLLLIVPKRKHSIIKYCAPRISGKNPKNLIVIYKVNHIRFRHMYAPNP